MHGINIQSSPLVTGEVPGNLLTKARVSGGKFERGSVTFF